MKGPFAAACCVCPALLQAWGSNSSTAAAPSGASENLLLLSITAELVAEAAGADSAPGPGLDGSLGCLGEWELPLFLTLPHTKLVTSGSAQQTGSL